MYLKALRPSYGIEVVSGHNNSLRNPPESPVIPEFPSILLVGCETSNSSYLVVSF
jgi:hypothetical protein